MVSLYLLLIWPGQRAPAAVSFFVGIPASLVTTVLVYLFQAPDFEIAGIPEPAEGRLPGSRPDVTTARWVHVSVRNSSRGLLGGGTAAGVSAVLWYHGLGEYSTKWAELPNPLDILTIETREGPRLAFVPNLLQMDSCKRITIEAGESKDLDIAVKFDGDPNCYIAVPENFRYSDLRNPLARLLPGTHTFELQINYRGNKTSLGEFRLHNGSSESSRDLYLSRVRGMPTNRSARR